MGNTVELWKRLELLLPWLGKNRGRILSWMYIGVVGRYLGFSPPLILERVLGPNGIRIAGTAAFVSVQLAYLGLAGCAVFLLLVSLDTLTQHGSHFLAEGIIRARKLASSLLQHRGGGAALTDHYGQIASPATSQSSFELPSLAKTFSASLYLTLLGLGMALLFAHDPYPLINAGDSNPLLGIAVCLTFLGTALGLRLSGDMLDRGSMARLAAFGLVWTWIATVAFWPLFTESFVFLRFCAPGLTAGLVIQGIRLARRTRAEVESSE